MEGCFGAQQRLSFVPCVVVSSAVTGSEVIPATPCSIITASGSPPALQRKPAKKNGLPTVGSPSVLRGSGPVFRSNAQRAQLRAGEAVAIASQRREGQARGAVGTRWKMLPVLPASEAGEKAERRHCGRPTSGALGPRFPRVKRPHGGPSWSLGGRRPSSSGSIGGWGYSSEESGRCRACAAEWAHSFPVRGGQLLWNWDPGSTAQSRTMR
jgi:hypothetical protein